ncbi:MAG: calcium/proton exchanger [Actinomycetota bacterium]|nr:calcium/proton exchanger [Actinomycetota bacterium]
MSRFFFSAQGWPYLLTPFILAAVLLEFVFHASPTVIFFCAAAGIIPTAALMGLATEELAARSGPGIGGFLNVTFGNAAELIIALFLLPEGLQEVVKATIIGSILGNLLLVLGLSMFVGGIGRQTQVFNRTAANAQSTMLFLAVAALLMPAIYALVQGGGLPSVDAEIVDFGSDLEQLSIGVAIVLGLTYMAGLIFSLRTHKDLFNPVAQDAEGEDGNGGHGHATYGWSVKKSITMLAVAGAAVGLVSEILVGSISEASESIGISEFFVGIIIVAVVGNAAEHWVAVLVARKNKMDLAVNISIGSAAQIALFVAPILVLVSFVLGPNPMPLVFNGFELGAVLVAVLIANYVTQEGESNWFEGVQLLAVYLVLALAFLYA